MSKVSVIMPAYNAERYLPDAIRSVQSQTFTDWELVICDDCSKDSTYQIANDFAQKDTRIKVIKNKVNSGVAQTRNNALDAAIGEYIAFLDSDDLWLPDKLKKQLEFMGDKSCVLSYTAYQKFFDNTEKKGKVIPAKEHMTAKQIYGDTSIGCLTVLVNRQQAGAFHMPLLKHTEDNCTWQEILSRGHIAYGLNEVLALYREGNDSLTSSKKKAAMQQWETYRKHYRFSVVKSLYYFLQYAVNALKKHI